MKLQAEIDNKKYEVEFKRDGYNLTATVDGRSYAIEASEPEPNVYLFKNDHKISQAVVSPAPQNTLNVRLGTNEFAIKLTDPRRLKGTATADADVDGRAEIRSAMPGRVVRILVKAGDVVQHGDGIIVVEAMKMQNELKSPKDGTVREMRAHDGDNVNAGDILVVIE